MSLRTRFELDLRPRGWVACGAAALTVGLHAASAVAEPATALDQLEPAPPDDAFLVVPSTRDPGRVRPAFGILLSDAHEPLVVATQDHETTDVVVERQIVMHLQASVGLFHRFTFDLDLPFTLQQEGERSPDDPVFPSPDGPAVNDLRIGGHFVALPQKGLLPGLGLGLSVWAPTGNPSLYTGASVGRVAPMVTFGGETPRVDWGTFVEGRFTPSVTDQLIGSQLRFGAGAAVKFAFLRVGPEIGVDLGTDANDGSIHLRTATIETFVVARAATGPVRITLAGGPGFGRAPGTPTFRVMFGASVAFDAIKDPPAKPGGDGEGGRSDAPPGADGADGQTTEPKPPLVVPEPKPLADRDGDGVPDPADACPAEPGAATADPKTSGCPTSVRLDGSQIVILEQVHFKTASSEIDPSSFDLLSQVAAVMNAHPEIARVAVDGHTDDRGADASNLLLSRKRAGAVVQWLTEHGVDARRTEARGFGARQPIADNTTDEGRAKNRRVEFNILRKTPDGAAGWKDGTVAPNVEKAAPKGTGGP